MYHCAALTKAPAIVISLDFELRWGMHDQLGLDRDAYRENLENARFIVVPELINIFKLRNIRATWAMVGAIGCANWTEYFDRAPKRPNYAKPQFAINPKYAELDPEGDLHFAPTLMNLIYQTEGQDLGSHTFSHVYMREPGFTEEDAIADFSAVKQLMQDKLNHTPISLVFPRNQNAFLKIIDQSGIEVWRGNEHPWYYEANDEKTNTGLPRGFRLIDSLNPFVKRAYPMIGHMTRASQFIRFSLPEPAWKLHLLRMTQNVSAMKPGDVFHIWWHPHNLGQNIKRCLSRANQLADMIAAGVIRGDWTSKNMADLWL